MRKKLYVILTAAAAIFAILGWQLLLMGDSLSPLPFGAMPSIVLAAMMTSSVSMVLAIAFALVFYAALFLTLRFSYRKRRWAMVTCTLLFCLDMAASLVFTAFSWWFIIGIVLDAVMIGLVWYMALRK